MLIDHQNAQHPRKIVLASSSKYRLQQLSERLQIPLSALPPNIDESLEPGESAQDAAARLSAAKVEAITRELTSTEVVIGGDQTAEFNGEILHKPGTPEKAMEQLLSFSGQRLDFYSGICIADRGSRTSTTEVVKTSVVFRQLHRAQVERYIAVDQPLDCVGAFKNEGLGIALFSEITSQDPSALTGLPLMQLVSILCDYGIDVI